MNVAIYDDRACLLGEGPLWHPIRNQLIWFDILNHSLMITGHQMHFDRAVSAAGWVDEHRLLVASETDLFLFDLRDGSSEHVLPIEADNAVTRSNDGRADPQGGFWIGTMGHQGETEAGALYRFYRGELRQIRDKVTIPNAICFTPDHRHAYFADTAEQIVWRYTLDEDGWPVPTPEIYLDHRGTQVNPDGAVVDAEGRFICAEWGGSRVACYNADGNLVEEIELPVPQPTCPAYGAGSLYVTSARQGMPGADIDAAPHSGKTLRIDVPFLGQKEHRVIL